ncbi:MAG: hypothetical protein OEU92_31650 [Alphaproteobacteria bacterium]|nr:hypothetical protein [Alphaproteobacteria bacterium]
MIDTLFFGLQIIGIVVVIGWAVLHDKLEEGTPTRGPLAFKQPERTAGGSAREPSANGGLTRHRGGSNLKNRRRNVKKSDL